MRIPSANDLHVALGELPAARPLLRAVAAERGVYLVGGAVRDLLLDREPGELDLVVEGDAVQVGRRLGGSVRIHDRFGTCTVTLGAFSYDLATARREVYPQPGALPEVSPAPLEEDLRRRDFTVNSVALGLGAEDRKDLVAVPEALEDLAAGRLRVLHERSFLDDPTRLLRMVRYATRLDFAPEPATRALAEAAVATSALDTVSGSRIGAELRLLAREPDPVHALHGLSELGLDAAIAPAFGLARPDVARRALSLLPDDGRADRLVLAAAALAMPDREVRSLLDRLAFTAADRNVIEVAAVGSQTLANTLARVRQPSEIARAAAGAPPELVALAGALGAAEPAKAWLTRLRHIRLEIDGEDLLAAGMAPGPAIGRALQAALAAKLDGRARGREDELAEALRTLGSTG